MNRIFYFILAAAVLMPAVAFAAGQAQTVSSYSNFTDWIPVIVVAVMLSLTLTSVYYMIGVALNNPTVKGHAISEFYQAIGTMALVVAIIFVLGIFGTTLTSVKSLVLSPSNVESICNAGALADSSFQFTNSTYSYGGQPGPTNIVCNQIIKGAANGNGVTANLDYGLAAVYVIQANLTNQTLANLNGLYFFEGEAGWLRTFTSVTVFCIPVLCAAPIFPSREFYAEYSYQPFTAYVLQRSTLPPVEITATLMFYLYILQMTVILLFFYLWPFLLAAGIVLRTFFFTRRAGGFLIALVLVTLILYPILFLFEYTALGNVNQLCAYTPSGVSGGATPSPADNQGSGNCVQAIGANSLPSLALNELPLSPLPGQTSIKPVQYQLNFYVFPQVSWVLNYYGCYPNGHGGLLAKEFSFASYYLAPGAGILYGAAFAGQGVPGVSTSILGIIGDILKGPSTIPTAVGFADPNGAFSCFLPANIAQSTIDIFNVYGVMGVTGFVLPLFNVLIVLAGILGLSGLMGGDTNLVGLARFI